MPKWTKEQEEAIVKSGSNIIVSAGAGSGKTAVLSERVINKIQNGIHVNELLILTFTRAAADEMKDRIRKKIGKIPEFKDGTLMLYGVAREAGVRSKVAVYSTNPRVDAIGTCIGERGCRIGSILSELNGEKVDLVLYSEDPAEFIKNALNPAKDVIVSIIDDEKERVALAVVNEDNLSLAIGKKGINIKLASKLTRFRINIKTMEEIQAEGNQ